MKRREVECLKCAADRLMDTDEVADYLSVSVRTVEAWRHNRTGPTGYLLRGRALRYKRGEVDAWVNAQAQVSA